MRASNGTDLVRATSEDVGLEDLPTASGIRALLERAERLIASLGIRAIDEVWSGLRPYREGGTRIGPDISRHGLYHAVGLHRNGILLVPLVAERIRERIRGGSR